ncbi:MAG: acyl-CoA ligase (AMP-forming), exosortase A system-associated [Nitrococcus sp.]|nr:acyl-CoA ligase (AMP-forming), exosortase A system-associated [Nitrococcus sp.]
MSYLIHDLIAQSASREPDAPALGDARETLTYASLAASVTRAAHALVALGLRAEERVAVYLEKRWETVVALFGAAAAGGVFVPVNPLLKPPQVAYILRDCNVRILITSAARLETLVEALDQSHDLHTVIVVDPIDALPAVGTCNVLSWEQWMRLESRRALPRRIDNDLAAILYTSGSTGQPKGVVLSHRNLIAGAMSVAKYLENRPQDRILAVLPLSFDYGLSQLTTAFHAGACAVLMNYLLPRDVIQAVVKERIAGLAAVAPLWIQLSQLQWPVRAVESLRYITNSGGAMPRSTLDALRQSLPRSRVYLMYGLTEAFRSTFLPPEELDRRPDSIGKAIPNAEILVLREDGTPCAPNEPGELVHRGALVSRGYWNAPEKTAARYREIPGYNGALSTPELAVWSGDTVRTDDEGFLYFIGRRDEMIKTSGYRVSPSEIEEVLDASGLVSEAAAFGVSHPVLGQAIIIVVTPRRDDHPPSVQTLLDECRRTLPAFMVPAHAEVRSSTLPRNSNGKIDRKELSMAFAGLFEGENATCR